MGDGTPNAMNLDLNLGPSPSPEYEPDFGPLPTEPVTLDDWIHQQRANHRLREAVRLRARRLETVLRHVPVPLENGNIAFGLMINSRNADGGSLQAGEGSVPFEGRNDEVTKTCENNATHEGDGALGKKEVEEKGNGEEGSFFDCHICLELARDPVVTSCGHLFCWPCLYRWLHVHSDAKECPVCKGEVTVKNVTPIYGRGNSTHETEEDPSLKIPTRPHAQRIDSWRQIIQRSGYPFPMEEMIRRLGNRFDLTRDLVQVQPQNTDNERDSPERNNSLLNRILTSSGMRREQNTVVPQEAAVDVDLTQSSPTNSDVGESRRVSSLLLRRSHSHRASTISNLTSALSSAERLVESYFQYHRLERDPEQPPPVDDRDSVSSIAAVIHSESQTVDTAVEIDSNVALSTSSSRRRNDASRVSDVDSGDSRPYRRRRLN